MKQLLRFIVAFVVSVSLALPQAWAASATFTTMDPTGSYLPNPEKGRIYWAGSDVIGSYDSTSVSSAASAGWRLVMFRVDLASYRTGAIDSSLLTTLQARFDDARSKGVKTVPWFYYNFGSGGQDATLSQMQSHLAQLGPVLTANADVIPYIKAGFIGAWAEWHSSTNCYSYNVGTNCGSPSQSTAQSGRAGVRDALLLNTHPATFVGFRYVLDPSFWYATPVNGTTAYRGKQGRIAFQNDCPMSSDGNTWFNPYGHMSTANQKTYAATMTDRVPFFGEVSTSCSGYTASCATTISEFSTYHATAFKTDPGDAAAFTSAWTSGGCFNEVYNRMGYFLQLKTLNHADSVSAGNSVTFTITARNVGWSRIHTERRLEVVLSKTGQTTFVCGRSMQLRALPAQDTSDRTLEVTCRVPGGTATGAWNVHLRIPDIWPNTKGVAAFAIRPANSDSGGQSWDATNFRFTTGTTLTVN